MNQEIVVDGDIRVYNKDYNGCKNHGRFVMITVMKDGEFIDIFLDKIQAYDLLNYLGDYLSPEIVNNDEFPPI